MRRYLLFIIFLVSLLGATTYQTYRNTEKTLPLPSMTPLAITETDQDYGFTIATPTLTRSVTTVFGRPVVLYCDTAVTEETNVCPQHGISISIYEVPEFGGSCFDFEKNIDMTKSITINNQDTRYCDDIGAKAISQIYIDRSSEGKTSYSLMATYDDVYTKAEALRALTTFTLTNPEKL